MYSISNNSNLNYNSYETYLNTHITNFDLKSEDISLSNNEAINIYTNPKASLIDAKISFLANIAYGLAEGKQLLTEFRFINV